MTELVFVVPGRLDQLTGGYLYDRHIIDGLRSRGHAMKVIELAPNDRETALAGLADDTTTVIDGLALPDLEQAVFAHCGSSGSSTIRSPKKLGFPPRRLSASFGSRLPRCNAFAASFAPAHGRLPRSRPMASRATASS